MLDTGYWFVKFEVTTLKCLKLIMKNSDLNLDAFVKSQKSENRT